MTDGNDDAQRPSFPAGDGETMVLTRALDWSKTPLGPITAWPHSLKTAVDICLNSPLSTVLLWGPERVMIYNDGYAAICGSKHPAALGQRCQDVWPELWADWNLPLSERVLQGERVTARDKLHTLERDGALADAWFDLFFSPVRSDDREKVDGVMIVAIETTERVLTERHLRTANERIQLALDAQAVLGTWVWDIPADRFTADARFARSFSLDPERCATGLPLSTVMASMHPEDQVRVASEIARTVARGGRYRSEYRVRQLDGTFRWVEANGHCEQGADGRPMRFLGVLIDIEHRKHAENALRESELQFRTLSEIVPEIVWMASSDGRSTYTNPFWSDFTGLTPEASHGAGWASVIHPDHRAHVLEVWRHALETGESFEVHIPFRDREGGYRWFLTRGMPVRRLDDTIERWMGTGTDVTEVTHAREALARNAEDLERRVKERTQALLQAEEALRQSQKMEAIGQLTGGIAHDFNNLLGGIIGALDILQKRVATGRLEGMQRYIDVAIRSSTKAAALTHRLLAFSRRQSLDIQPTDVNALIGSLEDLLRRTMGENVELAMLLDAGLWAATTDANQFENALLNLCINARDAMAGGGKLTIETANTHLDAAYVQDKDGLDAGDYVVICVSDTGSGMPPDVIARAFDPFFTTKPIGQGTGLGLSMIYGFAKQSGGHVSIYSEVDKGTTVKLYLSRHQALMEKTSAPERERPKAEAGETVLVVEDDPVVRMVMLDVLHDLGYAALEATDARSAIPFLENGQRIDLLVTDVGLPGLNGRQLAEIARQRRPELPVLFVTGYAEGAALRGGFLGQGMEMIMKPFAIDALATKIREMIVLS